MSRTFLKGAAVLVPIAVIAGFFYWLLTATEKVLRAFFLFVLPDELYIPGLGIFAGLLICYSVGLALNSKRAQEIFDQWERGVKKIPLIKTFYGGIQDVLQVFSSDKSKKYDRVVMVTLKDSGLRFIGFVTRKDLPLLENGDNVKRIPVYLPMSYQIGGYFMMVPADQVQHLDISFEDASRLILTAAMSVGVQKPSVSAAPESSARTPFTGT